MAVRLRTPSKFLISEQSELTRTIGKYNVNKVKSYTIPPNDYCIHPNMGGK